MYQYNTEQFYYLNLCVKIPNKYILMKEIPN